MMIEAVTKGFISRSQPAKKLKQRWKVIRQLKDYERCVAEIENFNVDVLLVTVEMIRASADIRHT